MARRKAKTKEPAPARSGLLWIVGLTIGILWLAIGVAAYVKLGGVQVPPPGSTRSETLQPLSPDEVQSVMTEKKKGLMERYQAGKTDSFTEDEVEWMLQSKDAYLILLGAEVLEKREDHERAIDIYEKFIALDRTKDDIPSSFFDIAFNKLIVHHATANDAGSLGRVVKKAVQERDHDLYIDRWFAMWIETLLSSKKMDEAYNVASECLAIFESTNIDPKFCLERIGALETRRGNIKEGREYYIRGYQGAAREWVDSQGKLCPAQVVPLAFDDLPEDIRDLKTETMYATLEISDSEADTSCSEQAWPFHSKEGNLEYFLGHKYEELGCYDAKETTVHIMNDVSVSGEYKIISKENDNSCVLYIPGYPFLEAKAQPLSSYNNLPVKNLDNVLFLHTFDANFHHFTSECLSKIFLALGHPQLKDIKNLTFLMSRTPVSEQFVDLLGIRDRTEFYEPAKHRYLIHQLYVIEWNVTKELFKPLYYPVEHYIPPSSVLHMTHQKLLGLIPTDNERNLVVFIQRNEEQRSIRDHTKLYQMFDYVAEKFGLEFQVHNSQELSVSEQMQLAHRAVALIGYHGAGLANMMFCQEDTAIIEIPVFPTEVSPFARMASILRFPYYTVPKASIGRYDSVESLPQDSMAQLEHTLYLSLVSFGLTPQ